MSFPPMGDEFYTQHPQEVYQGEWTNMKAKLGKQTGLALALLATLLATFLAMGVFSVAQANEHSATRSFSSDTVAPGAEITVNIALSAYGDGGSVAETLPQGFSFVSGSDDLVGGGGFVRPSGNQVRVVLAGAGVTNVIYKVTAPPAAGGPFTFTGNFVNFDGESVDIGGDSMVTVAAPTTNGGNGDGNGNGEADAESAALNTNKASSATRLTITGSGSQLGDVGPGDEIVINLASFGLPGSIDEADVTIDDGNNTANPRSVSVGGSNITLQLDKFVSGEPNSHSDNIIDSDDGEITITVRDRAGITTPVKAGMYTVKVDAKDRSDADGYDLDGDNMMVPIIRSISVKPASRQSGARKSP